MKYDFGTLKFKDEEEYYSALGIFCNSNAFTISYEPNKSTGSYGDAYRMRKLATAKILIKPIRDALRSNGRVNCNDYVINLISKHNFVQNGKHIYGVLENVIKTVPSTYTGCFMNGYTNAAMEKKDSIIVFETENIKETAASLEKRPVPKSPSTKPRIKSSQYKTKHDYIKEQIRNSDIGERGEKLVFELEKKKLLDAKKQGKIKSIKNLLQWVSIENDSAGYDIMSYDVENRKPIYIEVKTTTGNRLTPFYMSEKELEFSKKNADQYHLYRVYNIKNNIAEYFDLQGDISKSTEVIIDAVNYIVTIK